VSELCDVSEEEEEEAGDHFIQVSVVSSGQAPVEVCC